MSFSLLPPIKMIKIHLFNGVKEYVLRKRVKNYSEKKIGKPTIG